MQLMMPKCAALYVYFPSPIDIPPFKPPMDFNFGINLLRLLTFHFGLLPFLCLMTFITVMDVICEFWSQNFSRSLPIRETWLLEKCEPDSSYWRDVFIVLLNRTHDIKPDLCYWMSWTSRFTIIRIWLGSKRWWHHHHQFNLKECSCQKLTY